MLQIKGISKEYKTGELVQRALDNVSLNLRDNEFVAILGPSGSGKTTLLNIIGGLDRYDGGDLIINGTSTKMYKERDWDTYRNHSIGFVFQSYNLIQHQTVLANVELALTISGLSPRERKERAVKALEQVGLGDQIQKKPNQMSGGQMQRVALARALVNDPDILLADEPTGALDSETSIQVMNLMKEVAQDRLVVMVTHNPELAEEYATRIVRLKDGRIIDDSMPCSDEELSRGTGGVPVGAAAGLPEEETYAKAKTAAGTEKDTETETAAGAEEADAPGGAAKKRKSSMSFLTSLALSFSNLRTKKGRTILTSFAGSIGIIGIALILSLSTGVNDYIDKIQRDTMASYPISISATSFDLTSIMANAGNGMGTFEDETNPEGQEEEQKGISASFRDIRTSSAVTTSIKENNLTEFKKYLDNKDSEIHQYIGDNGIVYTYNVDFKVYSYDKNHRLVDSDLDPTLEFADDNNILGNLTGARSLMLDNMSAMFGVGSQNAANFTEMTAGANGDIISAMIRDNYDIVYGSWPDSYDEVILVLNDNGTFSSGALYQLGLITKQQYEAAVKAVEAEQEPEPITLDYQELCSHEFLLLTASDLFIKNEDGSFSQTGDDPDKLEEILQDATRLKIVGIVKEKEDSGVSSLNTPVAYTTKLTDYIIEYTNKSDAVVAQQASKETDILSGQTFMETEPDDDSKEARAREYIESLSESGKAEFLSSLMAVDYQGSMEAMMTTQMGSLSEQIGASLQNAIGSAIQGTIQTVLETAVTQIVNQIMLTMVQNAEVMIGQVTGKMMEQAMQALSGEVMQQTMNLILGQVMQEVLPQVICEFGTKVLPQILYKTVAGNITRILDQVKEKLPADFVKEAEKLKEAKDFKEYLELFESIDFEKYDFSSIDLSDIDYNILSFENIDFSDIDFSGIDLSKLDFSEIDLSGIDLSRLNFEEFDFSSLGLEGMDLSGMDFSGMDFGSMDLSGMDLSGMDFSGMDFSTLGSSANTQSDSASSAATVDYWLNNTADRKALVRVYDQFIGVSSYDGNMKKFGYISYDTPSSISLYADSFEGKDGIAASLKHYNEQASKENQITYTDYVALLTSSITTIINAISYVLIGFVGVSLFVSCIMIGIITNISVLERTKEIGVLRALGASRRNVSNVFNAETFIIGCFAGIIGVGVSLLLTIPINAIVHALMGSSVLSAKLPPVSAVILIVISIVITMIGGLIPANKAAKQDPVIALRTE